jgi:hypothetical protein
MEWVKYFRFIYSIPCGPGTKTERRTTAAPRTYQDFREEEKLIDADSEDVLQADIYPDQGRRWVVNADRSAAGLVIYFRGGSLSKRAAQ